VFEWDSKKAAANEAKHGISFEEAGSAFFDRNGLDGEDAEYSMTEPRRLRLVQSAVGNVIVIAYTLRSQGHEKNIRLISARLANRKEKRRNQETSD